MKKFLDNLFPDWEKLDEPMLKLYRIVGILFIIVGIVTISAFVPTIKIHMKILGGLVFGIGVKIFRHAHQHLDEK